MATQAEVREHQEVVAALALLAQTQLDDQLAAVDLEDAHRAAAVVRDLMPALSLAYTQAATSVSADWYDNLRAEAAVAGTYAATTLAEPDVDEVQEAVGYALVPLFREGEPAPAGATRARLLTLTETLVTSTDRQTVRVNASRDPQRPRYARHASANACAFCRMLATRGADYTSEESAMRVVLSRRRNKRKVGEKYHDSCRCTAVPVWGSKTYEEAPYVADWREAYYAATEKHGSANTKAILAEMRQTLGTN